MANSDEIETRRVEELKKLNEIRENLNIIQIKKHELEKELVEVSEVIRLARHTMSVVKTNIDVLTSEYWRSKT